MEEYPVITFIDSKTFDKPVWICFHKYYMIMEDSLPNFLNAIYNDWDSEHNIAG